MQVVMCLIFALTYAGAISLARARSSLLHVRLDSSVTLGKGAGSLLVRLPAGWRIENGNESGVRFVEADEPEGANHYGRILRVSRKVFSEAPPTAEEYLTSENIGRLIQTRPMTFRNLGVGILVETAPGHVLEDGEVHLTLPGLYACIVTPVTKHSRESLAIVIEYQGTASFGRSAATLLQAVADSIAPMTDKNIVRAAEMQPPSVARDAGFTQ